MQECPTGMQARMQASNNAQGQTATCSGTSMQAGSGRPQRNGASTIPLYRRHATNPSGGFAQSANFTSKAGKIRLMMKLEISAGDSAAYSAPLYCPD